LAELEAAKGGNRLLDIATEALKEDLNDPEDFELRARAVTERAALCLQASLLVRHAPAAVADAFCASRLGTRWHGAYGTLPKGADFSAIIDRIAPPDA
jgi:putative acyl-CoA dehydrogenase